MFLDSSLPKFPAAATKVLCYVNRSITSTGLSYMLHVLLNIHESCSVTCTALWAGPRHTCGWKPSKLTTTLIKHTCILPYILAIWFSIYMIVNKLMCLSSTQLNYINNLQNNCVDSQTVHMWPGLWKSTMWAQITPIYIFGNIFSSECRIPLPSISEESPLNSAVVTEIFLCLYKQFVS